MFANCHSGSPITSDHHRDIAGISGQGRQITKSHKNKRNWVVNKEFQIYKEGLLVILTHVPSQKLGYHLKEMHSELVFSSSSDLLSVQHFQRQKG